jgi:hypothetical protein
VLRSLARRWGAPGVSRRATNPAARWTTTPAATTVSSDDPAPPPLPCALLTLRACVRCCFVAALSGVACKLVAPDGSGMCDDADKTPCWGSWALTCARSLVPSLARQLAHSQPALGCSVVQSWQLDALRVGCSSVHQPTATTARPRTWSTSIPMTATS